MQTVNGERPIGSYRLRREGSGLRRRYVVTALDTNGQIEWEWEPLRRGAVFRRLEQAGHYVTDIWPLVTAADRRWADSR